MPRSGANGDRPPNKNLSAIPRVKPLAATVQSDNRTKKVHRTRGMHHSPQDDVWARFASNVPNASKRELEAL
eukprot:3151963-Amphidinium_carterae.1